MWRHSHGLKGYDRYWFVSDVTTREETGIIVLTNTSNFKSRDSVDEKRCGSSSEFYINALYDGESFRKTKYK